MSFGIDRPILMLVTNAARCRQPLEEVVRAAIAGGVDIVQIREPELDSDALASLSLKLRRIAEANWVEVVVNSRLDIAKKVGCGIHLPEDGVSIHAVRERLGEGVRIGRSVHSATAARASTGANYLVAGHLYPTVSHPGEPPIGIKAFQAIALATDIPVLAIGGITAGNAGEAIRAGAAGVAVIGAICESDDPKKAAADLRSIINAAFV